MQSRVAWHTGERGVVPAVLQHRSSHHRLPCQDVPCEDAPCERQDATTLDPMLYACAPSCSPFDMSSS